MLLDRGHLPERLDSVPIQCLLAMRYFGGLSKCLSNCPLFVYVLDMSYFYARSSTIVLEAFQDRASYVTAGEGFKDVSPTSLHATFLCLDCFESKEGAEQTESTHTVNLSVL